MALKRITMQDIADACGLSRNTVSKIFNSRGSVPEATRRFVLQKAEELGYMQFGAGTEPAPRQPAAPEKTPPQGMKNIVLLTKRIPNDYHFGALFLPSFTECLSRAGYTLTMYEVKDAALAEKRLPSHMVPEQTAGIITIEIFDADYLQMLSAQGIPLLSVDAFAGAGLAILDYDFISMENMASSIALTGHLIAQGAQKLGFIGDIRHCNSFYERFTGFSHALEEHGLKLDKKICILENDSEPYADEEWLVRQIERMPFLPDSFSCANDFLAINVLKALKKMNVSVPGGIRIAGFDGILQSEVIEPSLTTVKIPGAEIGKMAAEILLDRIRSSTKPFRKVYVKTLPVFRNSTL